MVFLEIKNVSTYGYFVNICDAVLYISLREGQKIINILTVVSISGVNLCTAALYKKILMHIPNPKSDFLLLKSGKITENRYF